MKYVAFLDILGFKKKLKKLNHNQAKKYISDFSTVAYTEWTSSDTTYVSGYIVSDSFIIYTTNTHDKSLFQLLSVIKRICEQEYTINGIMVRGAIAKGHFDNMAASEISNLSKGLIVGQAYVDAYLLEDTMKSVGIVLSRDVYQDIEIFNLNFNCYNESTDKTEKYIFSYFDFDFLCKRENLLKFIELGIESNWLPHYYNTLYFVLKSVNNKKRIYQLFDDLISLIGDPSENWRDIDNFIKNAFNSDVFPNFQTRFLGYIREKIDIHKSQRWIIDKRPNTREKVLQYLFNNPNSTQYQISNALEITVSSVSRTLKVLLEEKQIVENRLVGNTPNAREIIPTYSIAE